MIRIINQVSVEHKTQQSEDFCLLFNLASPDGAERFENLLKVAVWQRASADRGEINFCKHITSNNFSNEKIKVYLNFIMKSFKQIKQANLLFYEILLSYEIGIIEKKPCFWWLLVREKL